MWSRIYTQLKKHPIRSLFFFGWTVYFAVLWSDMLSLRPDGLYAGHPYVWADWSLHIGLASVIAYKPITLWFSAYPIYAGAKLTYPFMANLISGLLMRMGLSIPLSFVLPSLLCSVLVLYLLYQFFRMIFPKEGLRLVAMTAFLLSGGLGALLLTRSLGLSQVLTDSSIVTTQIPEQMIETNNILSSMIIPQRAFLLGLPMGLYIIVTLIQRLFLEKKLEPNTAHKSALILAGILAGLLPISHTHTFIVIGLFSLYLFVLTLSRFRDWLWYGIPALITTGLVFWFFLFGNVSASSFFSMHPGWLASGGVGEWVIFWWKNWGVFWIVSLFGSFLMYKKKEQVLKLVTVFFWGIFILANLFQFQPQLWDNTKLFAWSYLGLSASFSYGLYSLWNKKKLFSTGIAVLLFALSTFSGAVDVLHNLDNDAKTFRMLSSDQIDMAVWAREHTAPDSVFLTSEMVANPIAMLSGRSTLVGYSGWMFNFGLPYAQRLKDIESMYTSPLTHKETFDQYHINYMVVSTDEQQLAVSKNIPFEKVYSNPYGTLYKVSPVTTK